MINNLFNIYVYVLITIICYAIIYPRSAPRNVFSSVFRIVRQDVTKCCQEIWISLKNGLMLIFSSVNIVKFLELLVIETFILCVLEIMNFLIKVLMKIGKI